MNNKLLLTIIFSLIILSSCEKSELVKDDINLLSTTIPLKTALEELDATYSLLYGEDAVKSSIRDVSNIVTYTKNDIFGTQVKSNASSDVDEKLIYVVNYKNNGGYAILSADTRIKDPVIAVTESGNFIRNPKTKIVNEESLPTDPDLPEGFTIFNSELNDYYLADGGEGYISNLVDNYLGGELKKDPDSADDGSGGVDDNNNNGDGNNNNGGQVTTHKEYSNWSTDIAVSPLLQTLWHQNEPFNNLYKTPITRRKAPAGCATLYTVNWSFATPEIAKNFMRKNGYPNANRSNEYNSTLICNMLDANKPVFAAGISGNVDGHAWVIDGYKKQSRSVRVINTNTGEEVNSYINSRLLVHCNWGWNGSCNGYFINGLFKDTPTETDPNYGDTNGNIGSNYTWWHRI